MYLVGLATSPTIPILVVSLVWWWSERDERFRACTIVATAMTLRCFAMSLANCFSIIATHDGHQDFSLCHSKKLRHNGSEVSEPFHMMHFAVCFQPAAVKCRPFSSMRLLQLTELCTLHFTLATRSDTCSFRRMRDSKELRMLFATVLTGSQTPRILSDVSKCCVLPHCENVIANARRPRQVWSRPESKAAAFPRQHMLATPPPRLTPHVSTGFGSCTSHPCQPSRNLAHDCGRG